jgi:protein gp37
VTESYQKGLGVIGVWSDPDRASAMVAKSNIEWTDASWTPIRAKNLKTGKIGWHCEHDTTGCIHCYSEGMNLRLGTGLPFKPGHRKDVEIFLDEKMLQAPLHWKRPRMVFVCSMTDLFAEFMKDEWIDELFYIMEACPQHTFQVLTKRAARMQEYLSRVVSEDGPGTMLDNVWLGVSCERQIEFDKRETLLRATPAAVRFFSLEPLLSPIDMHRALYVGEEGGWEYVGSKRQMIGWVIVGGESGKEARPM